MEKKCFLHPRGRCTSPAPLRGYPIARMIERNGCDHPFLSIMPLYAVSFLRCCFFYVMAKEVSYMPCPHFKITITQRSRGQSAVAGAAYQSGEKLFSEYDLKWKSYVEKQGIVYTEIMLPAHAPPEYSDRNTLWNAAEKIEKQWNSQLARRIVLALPREVPADQYPAMLQDFCREHFVSHGMCVDFAIHDKSDGNPHAHIMLTMRAMDEQGKWLPKSKKVYDLDENGELIRLPSSNWKSHKEDTVDWNDQGKAEIWRHCWEVITNDYLERNDRPERVDLRSFERQGIDLAPTIHLGPAVTQMEKRGIETDMGNLNREIKQINRALLAIRKLIADLQSWIAELREKRNRLIEEMREPTLPELLTQYLDSRRDERSDWSVSGQRKGMTMDLKKVSHAVLYLQEHEIATVDDLQKHLAEKEASSNEFSNTIRGKEKRMRDVQALLKAWDSVSQLEALHKQYKGIGWKKKQEKFYQEHKAELDEYGKADRLLRKFYPSKKIPVSTLQKELDTLSAEVEALRPELDAVKADLTELRFVQNCITPEETNEEKGEKTLTEKQTTKEKASLIDRLHDKQQIVDEQKQKEKSHSHSYENEL